MDALNSVIAAVAVSWTALELRWRGFDRTCGGLLARADGVTDSQIEGLVEAYRRTAILPWSSCLSRSAALCRALRRRQVPAVLRIGALPAGGALLAHAWVELDGHPLTDPPGIVDDFPVLSRPRPAARR